MLARPETSRKDGWL